MSNKSSKSFDGQDREQGNPAQRKTGVEADDVRDNTGEYVSQGTRMGEQENLKNRGVQEDQPGNPVRNSGSTAAQDQEAPTGEPDPGEAKKLEKEDN